MSYFDNSEKRFEQDIESFLISEAGGYVQFSYLDSAGHRIYKYEFDKDKGIYLDVLVEFITKTQPKEWARYKRYYGDDAPEKLYRRLEASIVENGLIYVLKNGIEDMGIKLNVCYFKPESELNYSLVELYKSNILGCTRQFAYSRQNNKTIDIALSLNGIPIVALELKNQYKGQDVDCAITQYKNDRDPKEFCFRFNHRFLVYFAVDLYDVYITTQLKGPSTRFIPFNQGSNGPGKTGGKGNPDNKDGYATAYLWENVLQRDNLIDIIHRFVLLIKEKEEVRDINGAIRFKEIPKIVFPRYHQYDVVKKIVADVRQHGVGRNYLIEHSAGSGKSMSIAWTSYRLASLHDEDNNFIFSSVIVVTNRIVLDSQLQDTINSFDHTPGLVEAIDDKKRSRGLSEAINDKKRIIICTIQKFLFAYKDFDKFKGSNFAIIVDEAHQGQNGESARILRKSLVDIDRAVKQYAQEEGIDEDEVDLTDDIVYSIIAQGLHTNQSFFAFTATPKNKTIELFGTKDDTIDKKRPFHTYSMRQAIEEGYILDVLLHYTTIKEAFKLVRVSKDNPELIEGPAHKALVKYYKEHGHTISDKTNIIMANFLENGRFQIEGKGKAMVVADSRANAVRYYFAIKEYLKAHPEEGTGCGVLIAFSGTVKIDENQYTEVGLNIDSNGRSLNSDKKLRKAFRSDKYNILVVANKYQTGFDEALLHSMYIDKKLKDVNAVQTISRLNRICRGKDSTFVLDFVNTDEDIRKSFQPYYETTMLEGRTDYNMVYDLRSKIKPYLLYNSDDIDRYYKFMSMHNGKKQDATSLGRLSGIMKPVIERYLEIDTEEGKYNCKMAVSKFVKAYAFITQLVRLHDVEIFKEYLFDSNLLKLLPKAGHPVIDVDDKIKLEYASLKETFNGAILLDKKDIDLMPSTGKIKTKVPKTDTLQSIIDKVNERFDGEFNDGDKVIIKNIYQMVLVDKDIKKYTRYAKTENQEMFINSLFPEKFKEIVTQCYRDNADSYKKLFTDTNFYESIKNAMAAEIYKALRKD